MPLKSSIRRLLIATAIFAVVAALFHRGYILNEVAQENRVGPVAVSIRGLLYQLLAILLTIVALSTLLFGKNGTAWSFVFVGSVLLLLLVFVTLFRQGII